MWELTRWGWTSLLQHGHWMKVEPDRWRTCRVDGLPTLHNRLVIPGQVQVEAALSDGALLVLMVV